MLDKNIITAVSKGEMAPVYLYFNNPQHSVNDVDAKGASLLHYAAAYSQGPMIDFLMGKGANIEVKDRNENTPLHYAANANNLKSTTLLLTKYGADINAKDVFGFPPLWYAVDKDHTQIVKRLIDHYANVDKTWSMGISVLHVAITSKVSLNTFILLIDATDLSKLTASPYSTNLLISLAMDFKRQDIVDEIQKKLNAAKEKEALSKQKIEELRTSLTLAIPATLFGNKHQNSPLIPTKQALRLKL